MFVMESSINRIRGSKGESRLEIESYYVWSLECYVAWGTCPILLYFPSSKFNNIL